MRTRTRVTISIEEAASLIKKGEIVAFPTETVYGLGANALNATAVRKIFEAKGRPNDNPLIVHVHAISQIHAIARITPIARTLMKAFWPGPLSIVLPKKKTIPKEVTAGHSSVCIRMPALFITRQFLKKAGIPVAAPSANISGRPSPTTWKHVYHDLHGKIPLILMGKSTQHGIESTVIDCTKKIPILLRPGSITQEEIEKTIGKIKSHKKGKKMKSPGMKHKHYAPTAMVKIIDEPAEIQKTTSKIAYIGMKRCTLKILKMNPKNVKQYARAAFHFFRKCDDKKIKIIYAQRIEKKEIGTALMDRLERAAKR